MVSKASDDFPDPDNPVKTISLSRGNSSETFRWLCSRAPRITSLSLTSDTVSNPGIQGEGREGPNRHKADGGERRSITPLRWQEIRARQITRRIAEDRSRRLGVQSGYL